MTRADLDAMLDTILLQHIADLGKTGSGKTSTAKLIVERAVATDHRVCILDTVKSDWWGITSNADGTGPGLPFQILGGPHGHVPIHADAGKVVGQLVGSGKLPLSIIDMADFEPGGVQRFFVDFAQALKKSLTGVLILVIEEAHEVAPKERAGIGAETLAIHWAKKLATAGRSLGLRLLVCTQRVQQLHNSVLGSCDTLIAHRFTTPADQKPIVDWLKANTTRERAAEVEASLSSLPTGTGWVCAGEAQLFERVAFPRFKTYDNSATPTHDLAKPRPVKTAPVDTAALRDLIGAAVAEAEQDDPAALRATIAKLRADVGRQAQGDYDDGWAAGLREGDVVASARWAESMRTSNAAMLEAARRWQAGLDEIKQVTDRIAADIQTMTSPTRMEVPKIADAAATLQGLTPSATTPVQLPRRQELKARTVALGEKVALTGSQWNLLKALAWWATLGTDTPTRAQVAGRCGWAVTSGHLKNVMGSAKTAGLITYPAPGTVALTDLGRRVTPAPDLGKTVQDSVRAMLDGSQAKVFDVLRRTGRQDRVALASELGWEVTSGHMKNVLGSMKTLQVIEYPAPGQVALVDWLRR